MVGTLLLRGMLAGILAGLLGFAFLKTAGEPQVDRAITFESQMDAAKAKAEIAAAVARGLPAPKLEAEPELVSRRVQAGLGLFTGVMVYGTALGGLFALVFALVFNRATALGPRATSALLAAVGLVSAYIVPNLKYCANPPSVGDPATIGRRTALYFAMIALSIALMIGAGMLRRRLVPRLGLWNAALAAAGSYIAAVLIVAFVLPGVHEVPAAFPATVLWKFRIASLGAQVIVWTTIGLTFGALVEKAMAPERSFRKPAPAL